MFRESMRVESREKERNNNCSEEKMGANECREWEKAASSGVVGNRTPLHWCCDRGWLATAQLLITNGALVNATTKQGDSALLWAAKAGHGNLVELLLRNGADATLRNNRNEVALEFAANDEVSALISASVVQESQQSSGEALSSFPSLLRNAEEKNAVLEKILPLQVQAGVSLEKTSPSSGTNDTEKQAANEVLKEGGEVVIPSGIFSAYRKQASVSAPKKMKITLKKK
jgi:hypothetical protein